MLIAIYRIFNQRLKVLIGYDIHDDDDYILGNLPPRYPVPAFDNHTIIAGDAVWQWQERKGYMRID